MKILIILLILLTGCTNKKQIENTPQNNQIIQTIEEGIIYNVASIIKNNDNTSLTIQILNNSKKDIEPTLISLEIKDKENNTITIIKSYISSQIKVGETREIQCNTDIDISSINNIDYKL